MAKIANADLLGTSQLRAAALAIAEAGLAAIDTETVFRSAVRHEGGVIHFFDARRCLGRGGRLFILAIGKTALGAAKVIEERLGPIISDGIAYDVREGKLSKIRAYAGDHPFPTDRNEWVTGEILSMLSGLSEHDVVLAVISGGASALLAAPSGIVPAREAALITDMFRAGLDINLMNTVRKHLSRARGGFLAKVAYPASIVTAAISDVPGNDLNFVGSAPTIRDASTIADARRVLADYKLLTPDLEAALLETPKDDRYFKRSSAFLALSSRTALDAMAHRAEAEGFAAKIVTDELQGEAREVALRIAREISETPPGTALLYGGETTVTVSGGGKGGRNQELALAALAHLPPDCLILPFASDGRDRSDVAGAICDILTKERALALGLDPAPLLRANDEYDFFKATGSAVVTGDTGSNVSDLIIALHGTETQAHHTVSRIID